MLQVTELYSGYGKSEVIRGISLKVEEGQIVTIIGPNGAGKTTLFRTIYGLLPVRQGEILFESQDLTKVSPFLRIKLGIALVPQGRNVFPYLSVLDNLELGAYTIAEKAKVQEGIEQSYNLFPRLRERMSQKAGTLSGGEQQMLVIARALMGRPKFLMLDEPSLGIAPLLVKEIFRTIRLINQDRNTTIFIVEQNAAIALKVAQWGYVMEGGKIFLSGPTQELLNDQRVKGAYLSKKD
ncbi:MAG: ABC transporter ATP-binding protein [Candidatus Tectomicrobia bacterium]|uniref:ABC transporter ATP-binding protein n=1 Tax=Tectimicrobiota bacterium TaxID=2528274 RepID=A0A933GNT3_UNCTE|nr:ABC transporter ATP-binding protein [Candidatus Tectomicrobia bacterium]